jgi:cytochrome c5
MARVPIILLTLWAFTPLTVSADEAHSNSSTDAPPAGLSSPERGLWFLLNKHYMASDLTQEEFDNLWKVWPEPLRSDAEKASPNERRKMAFSRYGLIEMPGRTLPMGFVSDGKQGWGMNCLACHGGKVAGDPIAGLPNSHFAFQTWAQDLVEYRVRFLGRKRSEFAQNLAVPLSRSNGSTNAQIFSVVLTALRDSDLVMKPFKEIHPPPLIHHDLDAPAFWNLKKKQNLYIDGYVSKSHRVIMQFVMLPTNSDERIKSWDNDFVDILAYAESVKPPRYKWPINRELSAKGEAVFNDHCSSCHGTYGQNASYPEKMIPIEEVGTDRRRLDGMPLEHRKFFEHGWISEDGKVKVVEQPTGYVAPPLDGVWASAPYFHNGSVPTLWHVLHPDQRPKVWLRSEDGYDTARVGLEVKEFAELPGEAKSADDKRKYFNTALPGKSAAGHDFPNALSEDERTALLEYLKSL